MITTRFQHLVLTCFLIVASPCLFAQGPLPRFTQAAEQMLRESDMQSASVGMSVVDVATGQVLYSHDADRGLATASTMKAITTASAMAILGPDFRFETKLAAAGEIREGVLYGDLVIIGTGDPSLGSDRHRASDGLDPLMYEWAQQLKNKGINTIRGSVIGDDSFFSTQLTPGNWGWEDMGNYYGAGPSALNICENTYRLDLSSSSQPGGTTTILRTDPPMQLFFVNELTAGAAGSGDNAYIYGAPYTQIRYVRGTIPPGKSLFTIKGSMPDPALFCAQQLAISLEKCGITIVDAPSTTRLRKLADKPLPRPTQVLYTHYSVPLTEIAQATNFNSINLYAEALARRIAVERGKEGTSIDGAIVMEGYWSGKGVNTRGMNPKDGSGLSPNNVVTASQFTSILSLASRSSYAASYLASLPVAGESGALKSSMKGTAAQGKIRAKSGYISGVRGYVGYADLPNGRRVAFAFVANHFEGSAGTMRSRWETLMVKLAEGQ